MGYLIIVAGNTGVGKTTLTRLLGEKMGMKVGLEEHSDHPFQVQFKKNSTMALNNQIDYLITRAEQEQVIRSGKSTGILDGGLEMDFFVFSRLFHEKGLLIDDEMTLLKRTYELLRRLLPPPELVIHMQATPELITERFLQRGRIVEIATLSDIKRMDSFLLEWLARVPSQRVITVDATVNDPTYASILPAVLEKMTAIQE